MPTYSLRNKETCEVFEHVMKIAEYDTYMKDNPNVERYHDGINIVSMNGSLDSKTDNTWTEVLSKVAEAHPTSTVGDRYGKKSIKQVKTQEIVKKHVDKITKRVN